MRARVNAIPHEGFWRLGRRWPCAGVEVDLSEADLTVLQAEPRLRVALLEAPAQPESPEEPAPKDDPDPPEPEQATEAAPSAPSTEPESDPEPAAPKGGKGRKR